MSIRRKRWSKPGCAGTGSVEPRGAPDAPSARGGGEMKVTWLSAAAAVPLTGCVAGNSGTAASPAAAFASIRAPEGPVVARAAIRQAGHSLVVRLDAAGLAPGT